MTKPIKIAGVCGSLRRQSYNASALEAAAALAPSQVEVDIIRLHDIPLFNEDVEAKGWPAPVAEIRKRVKESDAVLFATPEYNYSISGVLKNAVDWLSRPEGEAPLNGKPATIIGATPSTIGTARAQTAMRDLTFYNAMPLLTTSEVLINNAGQKFDDTGKLTDADTRKFLANMMREFVDWIIKIRN